MDIKLVSTGKIIKMYLDENEISALEVANASNVSLRTVLRILSDESKLCLDVAIGINKLLPQIKPDFLLSYDSKYQLQKRIVEKQNGSVKISKVVQNYQMKKLYRELCDDEIAMFEKAKQVFGLTNIINNYAVDVGGLSYCFSLANGDKNNHLIWLKAAYEDCVTDNDYQNLIFNEEAFFKYYAGLKEKTFTNDLMTTLYNMKSFCKKSGINFYYRPSIPGARVKAVAVKDREGRVFILVSDLFKCIENLWLAFVHECEHIKNKDFDKQNQIKAELVDKTVDENYIDQQAIEYFIGNQKPVTFNSVDDIILIAKQTNSPVSIVAEIARFKTNNYSDFSLNKYIHYYKSDVV